MCLVLFLIDRLPLFSSLMALWLSWYMILSWILYPCYFRKYLVNITWVITSYTQTSSASVELLVLILFLLEYAQALPVAMFINTPVWLLVYLCTKNSSSTYHFMFSDLFIGIISGRPMVTCMYFIPLDILLHLSVSGLLTLVQRNYTGVWISGRPLFERCISCAKNGEKDLSRYGTSWLYFLQYWRVGVQQVWMIPPSFIL